MSRPIVALVTLAVMWTGTVYGGTFFQDFVGVWRAKSKHINSTLRVQKEKNGVVSLRMTGAYLNKGRLKPNGTYEGETYLRGRRVESYTGTWWFSGANTLKIKVGGRAGVADTTVSRINSNRFVYKEPVNGAKSQVTLKRIRK